MAGTEQSPSPRLLPSTAPGSEISPDQPSPARSLRSRIAAMGQARLPARRGLGCSVLVLLLLLGGSGSPGTSPQPRGAWPQEHGAEPQRGPWGTGRYEAVKKHLGAVGALSKQYWRYVACRVWQEGCEEEEKPPEEREASAIPSKRFAPISAVFSLSLAAGLDTLLCPWFLWAALPSPWLLSRAFSPLA